MGAAWGYRDAPMTYGSLEEQRGALEERIGLLEVYKGARCGDVSQEECRGAPEGLLMLGG